MLEKLQEEILQSSNNILAKHHQKFFKTGKGEYGEGDVFLGLTVPQIRNICKKYLYLSFSDLKVLLKSPFHDYRFASLVILVENFKSSKKQKNLNMLKNIFDFYLSNTHGINNRDLVDLSCRDIVGGYLLDKKDRKVLYDLANSQNLREQRIAIVSTRTFIKFGQFDDCLNISKKLLGHNHDLMHKAVGRMLREVGKKNDKLLKSFLKENYKNIPRTTLRYAIEKFEKTERKMYLQGFF